MVRIITDSAADFEPEEMQAMGILCIPIVVTIGERAYQENIDLSKTKFYELLAESGETPHTSQPSLEKFHKAFQAAKDAGEEAVYITLSSALSGTYQNASLVRNMGAYENCHVLDGHSATGGQRMLVEYAVKLRDEGKNAAEIVAAVETLRERVVLYACIDTLEYLHRGGRISGAAYHLGSMAHIKPLIHVGKAGDIELPGKALGMRMGMEHLCRYVEHSPPDKDFPLYVMYTHIRENGELLARRLRERGCDIPDERIINVGAAIGSHIGPNACGLVYIKS